jgi:hypothetical protein
MTVFQKVHMATKIGWQDHNSKFDNEKRESEKPEGGRIFGDRRSIAKQSQKTKTWNDGQKKSGRKLESTWIPILHIIYLL